jgi:parvulin-like peptidyl-prolyl isomerase
MNRMPFCLGVALLAFLLFLTGCNPTPTPPAEELVPESYDDALWLLAQQHHIALTEEEQSTIRQDALQDALALQEDAARLEEQYSRELLEQKLRDFLFPDVFAEDDAVEQWYEARVTALEQAFQKQPGLFKSQQEGYEQYGGIPPLVIPEGYVRFRHILTSQEEIAQQIWGDLEAGQSFEALQMQYNEDPGMREGPFAQLGYLTGPYPSTRDFVPELKEQVLALEKPGEYSPVFATKAGYHIVFLQEKLEPGILPLEKVEEPIAHLLTTALRQEMLEQKVYQK